MFHPGPRGTQVVVTEDGKLVKQPYKPPSNPDEIEPRGEAQSLVTASLMAQQTKAN